MPFFTILIVGGPPTERKFEPSDRHVKIMVAGSAGEAEVCIRTALVDMMLFSLNGENREAFRLCQLAMKRHPSTKAMFFSSAEALNDTLTAFSRLHAVQLKTVFSTENTAVAVPPAKFEPQIKELSQCSAADNNHFSYDKLIGDSPEIQKIKNLVLKIAPTNTTILLQGESGTGKEVIARAVHVHSTRKNEPFVPVDCAAINESVIESELFGHTKGAFTGADRDTIGLIRSADKGTLFLDEIAELPIVLQVKLLRTLQERMVRPVGSSKSYPVDIRIIAATNCNLADAVKKGTFRQDLYFRLNVITIFAPPLCEHRADIPLLCNHFISKLVSDGFPEKRFSESAMQTMTNYDWPGNIRELENVIRRGVILSQEEVIQSSELPISANMPEDGIGTTYLKPSSMAAHEKEAIRNALDQTAGNRRAAAQILGISEATLYRRIKLYGI